jgi:hypothetical protein
VAKHLVPDRIKLFEDISLSRVTVSRRIEEMALQLENKLMVKSSELRFYSLALDETTDNANTAQLAVFIRGVSENCEIIEELLALVGMHGTTTGEDIFNELDKIIKKYDLPYNKLSGISTDGAPAMVGAQKGVIALIKKKLLQLNIDPSKLFVSHCIIHQENLCAQCLKIPHVMNIVVRCVNYLKRHGLNSRQFKEFLADMDAEYRDVSYYCEVRWLSRGNMINRFWYLREEIKLFMEMKGEEVPQLCDQKWLCDLAFVVDITSHLNTSNLNLQGPNQLINSLLSHVKSFKAKLILWINQLNNGDTTHFPTLKSQSPLATVSFAEDLKILLSEFDRRFALMKENDKDFRLFETPLNIDPAEAPEEFQLELIELQSDGSLQAKYNTMTLLDFYKGQIPAMKFPNLKLHALKMISLFGTTYCCEQFFSKLLIAKNKLRTKITDENLQHQLRIASSSTAPVIKNLVRDHQVQKSH